LPMRTIAISHEASACSMASTKSTPGSIPWTSIKRGRHRSERRADRRADPHNRAHRRAGS
jgi:hypothetical protein